MRPDDAPPRRPVHRILLTGVLDVLLLPLAIGVVLFDDVFWNAAQRLLRRLERLGVLRRARGWVRSLPAIAVLPLFLLPEATSHAAGFLGAFLLTKGKVTTAIILLVLVKGMATLAVVWIYQAASATLLAIPWFSWMHDAIGWVRDWSLSQVEPLRNALRDRLHRTSRIGSVIRRRFLALRLRLVALFSGKNMTF